MTAVVGFDGCRKGWLGALWQGPGHHPDAICLASLPQAEIDLQQQILTVAVDIPLGLQTAATPGAGFVTYKQGASWALVNLRFFLRRQRPRYPQETTPRQVR